MKTTSNKMTGAAMALAAASLFGTAVLAPATALADEAQVHCYGVNSCKGHNDCKTATNDCKGMGSCKGQGFLVMSKGDCDAKGGTVK